MKGKIKVNRKSVLITLVGILIAISVINVAVKAEMTEPGSKSDPLVTKSYVDDVINSLKKSLNLLDSDKPKASLSNLEIIKLTRDQRLIGAEGTEIILRSGHAVIIGGAGGGISDVTDGKDLTGKAVVPRNHLLIVPRDDYRGVEAQTDNVIVLVRGVYSLSD